MKMRHLAALICLAVPLTGCYAHRHRDDHYPPPPVCDRDHPCDDHHLPPCDRDHPEPCDHSRPY